LDQAVEQLRTPLGISVGVVAIILALFVIRKALTVVFVLLAVGLGGWGVARQMGWDIPFVLPGEISEATRTTLEASRQALETNALADAEAIGSMTRSAAGPSPDASVAQAVADGVRTAEIRYNAPETMLLNMPVDMRLVIDASGMEDLKSLLEGLRGAMRKGQAELTRQVTASLYGSGFDIRPLKPERQVLIEDRASSWQWEVTPRQEGERTLILELFAHPGGSDAAAPVQEFRDEIEVRVTVLSRALGFMQTTQPVLGFAAAAVSLGLAGFSMVRRRKN
jgi:hypothetical protein